MFRVITGCLLSCGLLLTGMTSLGNNADVKAYHVGDKVPDFEVRTLKGKKTSLRALQSNEKTNSSGVTVLTFWCSFCGSCRQVDKPLSELSQRFDGQVAILALDSSAGEQAKTISKVLREKQLRMPVLLDGKGHLADLFGARMTTTTVIIDADNVIRYWGQFQHGEIPLAEQAIEAVLAGRKPPRDHTRERG
jgi:thiol-disulfide isomerase/thioredoxin